MIVMAWRYRGWDDDDTHQAKRSFDVDTGGWFYQFRDNNGAFSHVWAPSIDRWAIAIGRGVLAAQKEARPVGLAPDTARIRHEKQPVPK